MSRSELETSIKLEAPRSVKAPGVTAILGNTLYVVEKYEGLHLVDNSVRTAPRRVGFLKIPGVWQAQIIDGRLITDNSRDILSFDVSDPTSPFLLSRGRDLLPNPPAPHMRSGLGPHGDDSLVINYRDVTFERSGSLVS